MSVSVMSQADMARTSGINLDEGIDLQFKIPVLNGSQRQGDVYISRDDNARATTIVPPTGTPVVRGENGGNTHAIFSGDATKAVYCDVVENTTVDNLVVAYLTVPDGSVAYLGHPEHGFNGIGSGNYKITRQREMGDAMRRFIAD